MKRFTLLILCIFFLFITSCSTLEESDIDVKEQFLQIYFTSNYDNRYTEWKNNLEHIITNRSYVRKIEHAQKQYIHCVKNLVDNNLYERLIPGAYLLAYDRSAEDAGQIAVPVDIQLTLYSEHEEQKTYSFIVTLDINENGEHFQSEASGQITEIIVGNQACISHIWIKDTGIG